MQTAWGNVDRYYAAAPDESPCLIDRAAQQVSNCWAEALDRISPEIRDAVEQACKRWNAVVREYMRAETGLHFAADSRSVPIKVVDGLPAHVAEILEQFEGLEQLLLSRPAIVAVAKNARIMEGCVELASTTWGTDAGPAPIDDIKRVRITAEGWLKKLDAKQPAKQIMGIEEDVLGAYFFRIPQIRIYWIVLAITARALGVSIEALTIVVLAHELAHAYTHLGSDTDNEQWETAHFAASDLDIIEGLAQFYTHNVCRQLLARTSAPLDAYNVLLKQQSGPYTAHLQWVDGEGGSEIVRVSMIECRSKGITSSSEFATVIGRHRVGVRGRTQAVTNSQGASDRPRSGSAGMVVDTAKLDQYVRKLTQGTDLI